MKNATKHAEQLKSMLKKLPKELRAAERPTIDPIEAIVRASLMADATDDQAEAALEKIREEFTDFNELRVATELEVQSLLGEDYPHIEDRTATMRGVLQSIFERENMLKLDRLRELKKAEIRTYLSELGGMTPFVEGYLMLASFDGTALPVDASSQRYLADEELLEPESTLEEAQSFLESHLKADDAYPFFLYLREHAIGAKRRKK